MPMSARTLTVFARARAAPLFALAALVALAALAAAVLAPPTSAAPPPADLKLTLRLVEDSDNIVPAGGTLTLSGWLSSTTSNPIPEVVTGTLRVSGSQEWEDNGRSSYSVSYRENPDGAATGYSIDVQTRTEANGGDIVVVGAPYDNVRAIAMAGSVDVFVNDSFARRLTAPTPAADDKFGNSVAVGDEVIVVGAVGDNSVYVYSLAGALMATLTPGTGANKPTEFGIDVAIDDTASTIVVGSTGGHGGVTANGAAYIFTKPTAGWADANSDSAAAVTKTTATSDAGKMNGSAVAISGNGSVVAVGAPRRDTNSSGDDENGGVLIFRKPTTGGWVDATESALARTGESTSAIRVGAVLDINRDGSVIVAGAAGITTTASWAGAAYVWVAAGAAWMNIHSTPAKLTDGDAVAGDLFGNAVAVNDGGDEVVVSSAWKDGKAYVFKRDGASWAAATDADIDLTGGSYFGSSAAIDGDDTLVVGQTERAFALATLPTSTDHGQAYAFDLSATKTTTTGTPPVTTTTQDVQASNVLLDGEPGVCGSRTVDQVTTWSCPVYLDRGTTTTTGTAGQITIPAGTPDGTFTISANLTVDGKENVTATLPIKIGTVKEADRAEFGFARNPGNPTVTGDEEDYPSNIAVNGTTRLRLQILSSEGTAAGANSVSSLLFTTTSGTLSLLSPAGAASGNCALTCQVDVTKLNAANSGNIVVQLTHPGATNKASSTMVRAQVLPRGGGSLLDIDPVTVTFSGTATKLTISEPATGVLNVNTVAGSTEDNPGGRDDAETRDRLRLSVSLADANGSNVKALPPGATTTRITDPDGKVVWRSTSATGNFAVAWPLQKAGETAGSMVDDLDAAGNRQVQLDVNAAPTAPLKNGEYTLEVKAGTLVDTQTFTVSGGPETIEISEPDGELTIGGRFTLTATLSDADGSAVPDGTPVTFTASRTGALNVLVKVRETTKTKDGQVAITYEVVAAGRDSVRVSSGTAGNVRLITTAEVAPAEPAAPANPADSLSRKMPNDYSSWLGEGTTTASALLDGLGDGFSAILLWYNGAWLRYGVVDGRPVPGQSNFEVRPGAILWLTSG